MRLLPVATCLVMLTASVVAQAPPPSPFSATPLTFEVASVKPNKSGDTRSGADAEPSGRVTVTNLSLYDMIQRVFDLPRYELIEGERLPSWVTSERWDIIAKAPDGTGPQEWREMLRNLIINRFKVVARRETRELPVYALVFARADRRFGPQLRLSTADCAALVAAARAATAPGQVRVCGRRSGTGFISGLGVPLADLGKTLSPAAGRYVFDATGLPDLVDLDLKWTPTQGASDVAMPDGTSLFTAIQDQLGLRLEPRNAPTSVFVIESAERPAEE